MKPKSESRNTSPVADQLTVDAQRVPYCVTKRKEALDIYFQGFLLIFHLAKCPAIILQSFPQAVKPLYYHPYALESH